MQNPGSQIARQTEVFYGVAPTFNTPLYHWLSPLSEFPWFPKPVRLWVWAVAKSFLAMPRTLSSGLSLAPRWTWMKTTRRRLGQQKRRWQAWAPPLLSPAAWSMLAEHVECLHAIRVNIRGSKALVATMIATRSNKPLFYARRKFIRETVRVEHTYLVVERGVRQAGLGMQLTANALAVYSKMGLKEIQLDAGLTDGGLVWARVGYVPADLKQWERVKKVVRRNFRGLPRDVIFSEAPVYRDFREQLDLILKSENPLFIRQILRLDRDGELKVAANLSEDVSKLLLKNSRWRGTIQLDKAESIGRARDYLGERIEQGRVRRPEWW